MESRWVWLQKAPMRDFCGDGIVLYVDCVGDKIVQKYTHTHEYEYNEGNLNKITRLYQSPHPGCDIVLQFCKNLLINKTG